MRPRFLSWGIILDDVVFPDGRTAMGRLGGGGLYAAAAMRHWTSDVALVAQVGADFDASLLRVPALDDRWLIRTDRPTPRAWQLFEEDGTRTQIPRVTMEEWQRQLILRPSARSIPDGAEAAHFMGRGTPEEEEMVTALAARGLRLSAEPILTPPIDEMERGVIHRLLAAVELFSPGRLDAELLVGARPIPDLLRALSDLGPRIVALRRGAAGSILYDRTQDTFWQVPAAPARPVDVTGAGNAYCGALLVAHVQGAPLPEAAAAAAVSAALTLEQTGPAPLSPARQDEARRRRDALRPAIRPAAARMLAQEVGP